MSWYSKGNLGSVCLVADYQAKHAEKREASSARQVEGVIDWLISHPPARAFEGVSGTGMRQSQQLGRVFVVVSYTYLGGGMQLPACRRLRAWFSIYVCSGFLSVSSEWRAHVSKLEVRPFFSVGKLHCAMQAFVRCRFANRALRTCTHVSALEMRPFFLVWNLHYAVQMLCDDGC